MARRLRAGFIYIFVVLSIYLVFKQLLLGRYADNENTIYEEEELRFSGAPQSNSGGSDFALFTRAPQSAGVNCRGLFEGESQALQHAVDYMKTHPKIVVKDNAYVNMTKNCQLFKERRGYVTQPPSAEEADFPIAYSLLMYKEVEQAERLLRAIYRPQNSYCIHIDKDAPHEVQSAIAAIVKCFDNVFIASKLERIIYAGFSRLQADVNCMADQLRNSARWKYYINLASQAFPLKTNAEIVKILKTYNGANDIEGLPAITSRYVYHYNYSIPNKGKPVLKSSGVRKAKPPHGITIVKGSAYGVFSRAFVEFIINDKRAVDLLEWSKDTYSPDEHYWSTLHHLQHNSFLNTPGGYSGVPNKKPWLALYASWGPREPCKGKFVRGVCIFAVGDLPHLVTRKELFCNKFHLDYSHLALECMEELINNRTVSPPIFEYFYYKNLPFIKK